MESCSPTGRLVESGSVRCHDCISGYKLPLKSRSNLRRKPSSRKMQNTSFSGISFSSFLSSAENIFVHKNGEHKVEHPHPATAPGDDIEEGEIGVFGAEKYFNTELDDVGNCPGLYGRIYEKDYSKDHIQINHRPIHMDRTKLVQAKFTVEDEFDTRSFDDTRMKPAVQTQFDDPRKSLEVFGSSATNKRDIAKKLERKLYKLTWDAIPNVPTTISSSTCRSRHLEDDINSDSSSDLFEIGNNISGKGQASDDGMSSFIMSPYAPSETSIEWSVVTASVADCSFVSGYDDETISAKSIRSPKITNIVAKGAQRIRAGGILGCRKYKALMVAESAYRKR